MTGLFQHNFWNDFQPDGIAYPSPASGPGWAVGNFQDIQGYFSNQLHLTGAADTITFPNLVTGVEIGLVSVDVAPSAGASTVIFVGANGSYKVDLPSSTVHQTAFAGESHVLRGNDPDPTLELGAIHEIVLTGDESRFDKVQIVVIPTQGPLDLDVTAPPGQLTTIDVLAHAEAEAGLAGLQLPLTLKSFTQPSLTGSFTEQSSPSDPNKILFQYTPAAGQGTHPATLFYYTVKDANGATEEGSVQVTVDTPPVITITNENFPFVADRSVLGALDVPHGTPPLTALVHVSDADGDPVTLDVSAGAIFGTVRPLTEIDSADYEYEYDPPFISTYNATGALAPVSAIVGSDQFTLEASDLLAITDHTVQYEVPDYGPVPIRVFDNYDLLNSAYIIPFVVPENVGVSYYTHASTGARLLT